jgi:anti-sigma B factor antagonist
VTSAEAEESNTAAYTSPTLGNRFVDGGAAIELRLDSREEGDWTILDVKGEIDLYSSSTLREKIIQLVDEGRTRLIVNLTEVGFMDSSGLGVLVGALKRLTERGGKLVLACPEGSPLKVLTITGLDKVFPIHASVDEALRA